MIICIYFYVPWKPTIKNLTYNKAFMQTDTTSIKGTKCDCATSGIFIDIVTVVAIAIVIVVVIIVIIIIRIIIIIAIIIMSIIIIVYYYFYWFCDSYKGWAPSKNVWVRLTQI